MKHLLLLLASVFTLSTLRADTDTAAAIKGRKVYTCTYMANPPKDALAWSTSSMVKTEKNKESRFVAYNSEAAKNLWLDATTERAYEPDPKLKGRETSFYMVYDVKGWHIYIESLELEKQENGGSLEIFFVPGLNQVHYHQFMVAQPSDVAKVYDWGMPHRDYRSLKGAITVDSIATDVGFGSYVFIPWEAEYDRLPLNNDTWRFSFMRWATQVTWGGSVHETGNFGLITFEKPDQTVVDAIRVKMLTSAWAKFNDTAAQATKTWNDEKTGDRDFFTTRLEPAISAYKAIGNTLGDPASWNAATVTKAEATLKDWMEFGYEVAALRTAYLMDKQFDQ